MLKEALEQSGIPKLIGWDDHQAEDNVFQRAFSTAIYPFRLLITPTAIKAYLTTFLFLTTSAVLLSISTTAYAFFYYNYIPQSSLTVPIYLQYTTDAFPHARIPLAPVLISQQPYDVSIVLHMPRDPINLSAGNFMLDLTLHGKVEQPDKQVSKTPKIDQVPSSALYHSRRPALMPYASRTTSLVSKLVKMPLHVVGIKDVDSVTLTVPMFEEVEFKRGRDNIPTVADLEIQSQRVPNIVALPQLHVYSAQLVFQVRFHGLRYLVYSHRVAAFAVFTALFYVVSITTLATAWAAIALLLNAKEPDQKKIENVKIKEEVPVIKSEEEKVDLKGNWDAEFTPTDGSEIAGGRADEIADDEESEGDEDELQQYERLRKKMEVEARRRQMAHDSGIGTSMESDNAGLVRRTSQRSQK